MTIEMYPDFAALGRAVLGGINKLLPSKKGESTLYSGRVIAHYKNLAVNASPTKNKMVNSAARVAFAVAAFIPYMIATIGAGFADIAVMASKNLPKAYSLIKNRFSKKSSGKLQLAARAGAQFVYKNRKALLGALSFAMASGAAYYYKDAIAADLSRRVYEFNLSHASGLKWAKMRVFG